MMEKVNVRDESCKRAVSHKKKKDEEKLKWSSIKS